MLEKLSYRPDFHPFFPLDKRLYEKLSDLEQISYDLNCIYSYLYHSHARCFQGLELFKKIFPPVKINKFLPQNRQIYLAQMEHACLSIVSLLAAHLQFLLDNPDYSARKEAVLASLADLCNCLYTEIPRNMDAIHARKFNKIIARRNPHDNYSPDTIMEFGFDAQAGLTRLYEYTLDIRAVTQAPIFISYRNDGAGSGALYDHRVFQKITRRDTVILRDDKLALLINDKLLNAEFSLEYGVEIPGQNKKRPLYTNELDQLTLKEGLIVIPGLAEIDHRNKKYQEISAANKLRASFETSVLIAAEGNRPVLAICGGLYRLLETFGAKVAAIAGHQGMMPRINAYGQVISNNPAHAIYIAPGSLLARLCGGMLNQLTPEIMEVTSVHHQAAQEPLPKDFLDKFKISARTVVDSALGPFTKSIEAVESQKPGPSMIGVQFHPESAVGNSKDEQMQQALIKSLAEQGDDRRKEHVEKNRQEIFNNPYAIFHHLGAANIEEMIDRLENNDEFARSSSSSVSSMPGVDGVGYKLPGVGVVYKMSTASSSSSSLSSASAYAGSSPSVGEMLGKSIATAIATPDVAATKSKAAKRRARKKKCEEFIKPGN